MRQVRLNKGDIRKIVSEAVRRAVLESFEPNNPYELSPQFEEGLERLYRTYVKLKGFVDEYQAVVGRIIDGAENAGMEMVDHACDRYFDIQDAVGGSVYSFSFTFGFPDGGEDMDNRIEEMARSFKLIADARYGEVSAYATDSGVSVEYSVKFA